MKGSVTISIEIAQGKGKQQTFIQKEIGKIHAGMSFGELALLFNSIRNATITTLEDSSFIVLTKEVFQNYMKFKTPPNAEEVLKFFDSQEYFKENNLALPQKIQIVSKCDTKSFVSNAAILLQGQFVEQLNFIKKGLVKVYRKVMFKVIPQTGEIDSKNNSDPTSEEIAKGLYLELFLEIDEMYEGSLIAEYELINYKTSQCSFLAYTPTEVVSISRSDLKILPEKMLTKFNKQSKPYPPDDKLRTVFFQGLYWKTFKKDILQCTSIETKNERNVIEGKIMNREKPYQIPHEANLFVLDDSFNRDEEEDENQLEKQAFEPLNKFFSSQDDRVSELEHKKLSKESSNFSHQKAKKRKEQFPQDQKKNVKTPTPLKQTVMSSRSKVSLPPLEHSPISSSIHVTINEQQQQMSLSQIKNDDEQQKETKPLSQLEKKNLLMQQLFDSLSPKTKVVSSSKSQLPSSTKRKLSPLNSNQANVKKSLKLQRYLSPKMPQRNNIKMNNDIIENHIQSRIKNNV